MRDVCSELRDAILLTLMNINSKVSIRYDSSHSFSKNSSSSELRLSPNRIGYAFSETNHTVDSAPVPHMT